MNLILLLAIGVLAAFVVAALVLSSRSRIVRVIASVAALGFAGFCTFGFLASFEPSGSPGWPWQAAYGTLSVGSLAISTVLLFGGRRRRREIDATPK